MDPTNTQYISAWLRHALLPDCSPPVPYAFANDSGISIVQDDQQMTVVHFGSDPTINRNAVPSWPFFTGNLTANLTANNLTEAINETDFEWVPKDSNDVQVLLILIAYTVSFLLSFGGNTLAIIVFVRFDFWPKDLRLLLTNICIAGLTSAVLCLPFTLLYQLLQSWVFTGPLCRIIIFLQLAATIATILTHLAIGLNRLWVIVYPLKAANFQEYVWWIVGVIWLVAACISSPNLPETDVMPRTTDDGCYNGKLYLMCAETWDPKYVATYTWALMICMYFLPMIVLLCIYAIAGYVLSKSELILQNERHIAKRLETKRKVLRMLIVIFALFGLSWLPLHTFFIFQSFHEDFIMNNFEMAERVYWVIHWLATSNCFQNPIVYCFFDEKFKTGVARLFYGHQGRPGNKNSSQISQKLSNLQQKHLQLQTSSRPSPSPGPNRSVRPTASAMPTTMTGGDTKNNLISPSANKIGDSSSKPVAKAVSSPLVDVEVKKNNGPIVASSKKASNDELAMPLLASVQSPAEARAATNTCNSPTSSVAPDPSFFVLYEYTSI